MNDNPLLTIAIPTFDREAFLREALQSINAQSWKRTKVILFDNASPYSIEQFAGEFPELRITVLRSPENIGGQANFARAMAHTYDTPYVYIFHDDDTIHSAYLSDAIDALEKDSNIAWVGSLIARKRSGFDDMGAFVKRPEHIEVEHLSKFELADAFMNDLRLGFSTIIYRREALASTSPDAVRFNKWLDRPFLLEACGNNKIAVMHFPYINYRVHSAQDSAQPYRDHLSEMMNLVSYMKETGSNATTSRAFATRSAVCAAAVNARSLPEWRSIIRQFKERDLFRFADIRPRAFYYAARILLGRCYRFLLSR